MVLEALAADWRIWTVVAVMLGMLVLFVTEFFPFEVTALTGAVALALTQILTPVEAISGFSNEATITVLMMFILSAGIVQTGLIEALSRPLGWVMGRSIYRQVAVLVLLVGPVSAFINNTAAVAVLIPLIVRIAHNSGQSPSKLLIPLSFAAMLGGTLTLIGTSTNLLASSIRRDHGLGPFDMFEFGKAGLVVLAIGGLYLALVSPRLLPERVEARQIDERHHLREFLFEISVTPKSPLIGKRVGGAALVQQYGVDVLQLRRGKQDYDPVAEPMDYREGDRLLVRAKRSQLERMRDTGIVEIIPLAAGELEWERGDVVFSELVVGPGSSMRGKRLGQIDLWGRFKVRAVALLSRGLTHEDRLYHRRLREGDILLVQGNRRDLKLLHSGPDFLVLEDPGVAVVRPKKIPIALGILVGVIAVAAFGFAPIVLTATAGAVLMMITGVLRLEEMYRNIRWDVFFLLAGIIPLGIAMEKTGAAARMANFLAGNAEYLPPLAILGAVYLLTMILTEIISNNAAVVLVAPIAIQLALELGLNPITFLLAAMFAASTPFLTPVGYQTNLLVLGPGGYRFTDFTRVGAPLNAVLAVATPLTLNHFFPL